VVPLAWIVDKVVWRRVPRIPEHPLATRRPRLTSTHCRSAGHHGNE